MGEFQAEWQKQEVLDYLLLGRNSKAHQEYVAQLYLERQRWSVDAGIGYMVRFLLAQKFKRERR